MLHRRVRYHLYIHDGAMWGTRVYTYNNYSADASFNIVIIIFIFKYY